MLSASIARLERAVGVALFARSTRRVELTDAGHAMLPSARVALAASADAWPPLVGMQPYAGTVFFGLSSGIRYGMEDLLALLASRYPEVTFDVRHDGSAVPLIEHVRDARVDIAALFATPIPAGLSGIPLPGRPLVLAVAADHPLAKAQSVSLADLREETFALDRPGHNPAYGDTPHTVTCGSSS